MKKVITVSLELIFFQPEKCVLKITFHASGTIAKLSYMYLTHVGYVRMHFSILVSPDSHE